MGGGSDQQIAGIDAAASEFGLAFQIVDDILDVEGVAATLGKTTGKDAAAGKPTYPALYGMSSMPYAVPNDRAAGDGLQRVYGSSARNLACRTSSSACAHGCSGIFWRSTRPGRGRPPTDS